MYSTDLGETWTPVEGLPAGAKIRSDRVKASVLYAFSGGTFYRSTDGGATFTDTGATGLPAEGVDDFRVAPGKQGPRLALRAQRQGRGRRAACGAPRTAAPPGSASARVDLAIGVGFGKAAKRNGYPAIYTSATVGGQDGFFRSIDGGTTWQRINDDAHQWGNAGAVITGDPEIYGRVYLSGRGIIYGDIA